MTCGEPSRLVPPRTWTPGARITFTGLRSGDQTLVEGLFDRELEVGVVVARATDGMARLVPPFVAAEALALDARCSREVVVSSTQFASREVRGSDAVCEYPTGLPRAEVLSLGPPVDAGVFKKLSDGGCAFDRFASDVREVTGRLHASQMAGVTLEHVPIGPEFATWWRTTADGAAFAAQLTWRGEPVWIGTAQADGRTGTYLEASVGSVLGDSSCRDQVVISSRACRPSFAGSFAGDACRPFSDALGVGAELGAVWSTETGSCRAMPLLPGYRAFSVDPASRTALPRLPALPRTSRRLVVRWLEVPDAGTTSVVSDRFFDTQPETTCNPVPTASGPVVCAPVELASIDLFQDSSCRTALASGSSLGCAQPAFAVSWDGGRLKSVRRVLTPHTGPGFRQEGGSCVTAQRAAGEAWFVLGDTVAAEDAFATVTRLMP